MSVRKELPFDQVNAVALGQYPALLETWFPNGQKVDGGKEFAVGNLNGDAGGKDGGSVKVNIRTGEWMEMNGGDPKGGDPISLYAWAKCGGDRVRACREMGAALGVPGCTAPRGAEVVPFPVKDPPRESAREKWEPMVPPPDTVGEPKGMLAKWEHVYRYYDRAGRLLRFVVRNDAKGDEPKKVLPLTYGLLGGKAGWHYKHPNAPRSLYGLERLGGLPVLLQEGEEKTDLVQALMPEFACVSLTGGTGGKNCNDLKTLAGMTVVCCPDADKGGRDAMAEIADKLRALKCAVALIDHTGQDDKWDLGDAVKAGWDAERIAEYLRTRSVDRFAEAPDLGDIDEDGPDWGDDDGTPEPGGQEHGIVPLGHDKGLYYYLSRASGQVHALTPSKHVELELIAMADPVAYWLKREDLKKGDDKGGVDWKKAASWLMGWSHRVGIYRPDKIRGRGAWMDDGRAILHLGESLIVDGAFQRSLALGGSRFVYEAAQGLGQGIAEPVRNADAHKLLKLCQLLRWEKPISATLAAGWIAVAPICGVLKWRPSIWITGGSNSGKTTFLQEIIGPILGRGLDDGIAANAQSKTTEAGLRQILNSDARPVIFDEAEAEMLTDRTRMQSVIDLVRQSSSEGGAEIIKGTQNQSGAKRYRIRSAFLFSSINISLDHLADESRISVLDLYNPAPEELEQDRARWLELVALLADTAGNPEWCAGMVARSVRLMHVIRANAVTFKIAVIERLGSARAGDQLGTLLAGAYSLTCDREITLDEARAYLARPENDFAAAAAIGAPKDEQRLTSRLLQQKIKVDMGDKVIERPVGEVIAMAEEHGETVDWVYHNALKRVGLKLEDGGVWVSNTHHEIKTWLKDSPWSTQWGRALKRIPGAKSSDKQTVAFGKHDKTKAVWVPLKALEG
jgi:putative DNA primase/helicase